MAQRLYCWSSFSLKSLNYSAAIFHLIQAAIVLGIIQHLNHKAEQNGNHNYGLRDGVFQINKNVFVIASNSETSVLGGENVFDVSTKSEQSKCSLPPVDIWNTTKYIHSVLDSMNRTKHSQINIPKLLAIDTFTPPLGEMMINVQRNDVFMFDDNKYYVIPQKLYVGDIDIRYIIFAFFLLSGLFQLADGFLGAYQTSKETDYYHEKTPQPPRLLRFVEYSFSASIMILAIGVETGVNDIYTLCGIFTLIFATNLLGLIAEILCYCSEILINSDSCNTTLKKLDTLLPIRFHWLWVIPHFLGWITCLVGYAPLLDSYLQSTHCSERGPPGFVNVIVFLEFVLFSCFGFVQLYSLYYRTIFIQNPTVTSARSYTPLVATSRFGSNNYDNEELVMNIENDTSTSKNYTNVAEKADYMYILLSFIAKTQLAWLILAPALMS